MINALQQPDPDIVGEELGGKWIAWDEANVRIVATGSTAEEAKRNSQNAGVIEPILEFVPPSDAAFMAGV